MIIEILLVLVIILVAFVIFRILNLPAGGDNSEAVLREISRIESSVKDEISRNRTELGQSAKDSRDELSKTLKEFSESNELKLNRLTEIIDAKLKDVQEDSKGGRKELKEVLDDVKKELSKSLDDFSERQRQNFGNLIERLEVQNIENKAKLEQMSGIIEKSIRLLQEDNALKLEEMRKTVDEKLEKTLSERLGQSFETVGKQLIEVQKGLGEMQTLAQDVGGLKKVLSNVKMRGGIGEVQLEMLLEQILAPDQYQANVKTKSSSNDLVEFAIKLPGRDDNNSQVWLPVDAKFPKDIYEQLQTAYEIGDLVQIELAQKNLDSTIKRMAKDISDKYIDPPNTTDFGIMFLPFEGIYAEVVRKASLLEDLQRNYKIIVTGPTTLAAILNSLQMGFRTLAIQKRSSEVWQVLGAVKKEFEQFGNLLQKSQNNIQTGLNQLDEVMGKRTKAIQRKLRNVEGTNEFESKGLLDQALENNSLDEDIDS